MFNFIRNILKEALLTLKFLANSNQKNKNKIREAGAIPPLTKLLSSKNFYVQYNAAGVLATLARNKSIKDSIIIYIEKVEGLKELILKKHEYLRFFIKIG